MATLTRRRSNNRIKCLRDPQGRITTDEDKISDILQRYFAELFSSGQAGDMEEILSKVGEKISEAENYELTKEVTKEGITMALRQMGPLKAPESDGMNAFFFQRYWNIVEKELCDFVFDFFQECQTTRRNESHEYYPYPEGESPTYANGRSGHQPL